MDYLFNKEYLNFSIDEISLYENKTFIVRIIPDIKSTFFPPFHTRSIKVSYRLLEESLYRYWNPESNYTSNELVGSVVQGAYYSIPVKNLKNFDLFDISNTLIDLDNDIFNGNRVEESPYLERNISGDTIIENERIFDYLSCQTSNFNNVFIYCFNVGQGDSILLIASSGNSYLIDTNIYNKNDAKNFVNQIKSILRSHKLSESKLKGLIVTHKHLDHIRGLKYILDNDYFEIENFMVNNDYIHPTKSVNELLNSAKLKIPVWINLNRPGMITEGDTLICIRNPDVDTSNVKCAPDINDSSIGVCIRYHNSLAYLTGDLSGKILHKKFNCKRNHIKAKSVLKVSHHGSYTGTDLSIIKLLTPSHAFISAGTSKKYNHPDSSVVNLLKSNKVELSISKIEKKTMCYKLNLNSIHVHKL